MTYPDWSGTTQLDERMTAVGPEEVNGLNPHEWMAIGIDVGGG